MAAVTTALIGAGLGLTAAGTVTQMIGAQKQAAAGREIAAQEARAEEQRRKAMELDARRKTLEMIRQQQRARAMALSTATNQNAQGGSALGGAYGGIGGQTGTNMLGVSQNLEIGRNIFDINALISQQRMNMAGAGALTAMGGGLNAFGGQLIGNAAGFGRLFQGFGGYGYDDTNKYRGY